MSDKELHNERLNDLTHKLVLEVEDAAKALATTPDVASYEANVFFLMIQAQIAMSQELLEHVMKAAKAVGLKGAVPLSKEGHNIV